MIIVTLFGMLWGCSSEDNKQTAKEKMSGELFKVAYNNGCIECHSISATVVGPSWKAVAERYKSADTDAAKRLLIQSIKNGSKGKYFTWKGGNGMPALGKRVSNEAITQLVDFILALR